MDNKLFSAILVLICTAILLGCNNLFEPDPITNKDTDTIKSQNPFRFEKSPIDQVININVLMYDAYPLSAGVDWNMKSKVPYPCDSFFNARGIYYDEDYECWRLSEQARKEAEEKKQEERKTSNKSTRVPLPSNKKEDIAILNDGEEAPALEKPTTSMPMQETKPVEEPRPTKNPRALYQGSNNPQNGGSEGIMGLSGDQGKPNGLAGVRQYVGNGGHGGGTGYDLGGRGIKSLQRPNDDFSEEGIVKVNIWVNREGKVTRAEVSNRGTTTANNEMRQQAIKCALNSSFIPDPNAPEEQNGSITYTFLLN